PGESWLPHFAAVRSGGFCPPRGVWRPPLLLPEGYPVAWHPRASQTGYATVRAVAPGFLRFPGQPAERRRLRDCPDFAVRSPGRAVRCLPVLARVRLLPTASGRPAASKAAPPVFCGKHVLEDGS